MRIIPVEFDFHRPALADVPRSDAVIIALEHWLAQERPDIAAREALEIVLPWVNDLSSASGNFFSRPDPDFPPCAA